jgi:hypothetical protein
VSWVLLLPRRAPVGLPASFPDPVTLLQICGASGEERDEVLRRSRQAKNRQGRTECRRGNDCRRLLSRFAAVWIANQDAPAFLRRRCQSACEQRREETGAWAGPKWEGEKQIGVWMQKPPGLCRIALFASSFKSRLHRFFLVQLHERSVKRTGPLEALVRSFAGRTAGPVLITVG